MVWAVVSPKVSDLWKQRVVTPEPAAEPGDRGAGAGLAAQAPPQAPVLPCWLDALA